MPGITDVAIIPHTAFVPGGVAVGARRSGSASTRSDALDVVWGPGHGGRASPTRTCSRIWPAAELPLTPALARGKVARPAVHVLLPARRPARDQLRRRRRPGRQRRDLVQPEVADLGPGADRQEPRAARSTSVTVHVTQGGGSFGRHLFADAAFEAAAISQKLGKPVKLMWHRTDNFRQGRVHPMCTSRVRVDLLGRQRAQLRPATHERGHRLHPRARGDPERDVRDLPEGELARVLARRCSR